MALILKNEFGQPICPRCRTQFASIPSFCPSCGVAISGRRSVVHALGRVAIALAVPLILGGFLVWRRPPRVPKLPAAGTVKAVDTDTAVDPHSTFWSVLQSQVQGELIFRLFAGDVPVGMQVRDAEEGAFTDEIDETVRKTQVKVASGTTGEIRCPVLANRKYAFYVVNETDTVAKARVLVTVCWGSK